MTHTSEEIPNGRIKLIHTFGTVAKIKFDVSAPGRCKHLSAPPKCRRMMFDC